MANFIPEGTKGPTGLPQMSARRRNFIPDGEAVNPFRCVCGADFTDKENPAAALSSHVKWCDIANNGEAPARKAAREAAKAKAVTGPVNEAVIAPLPDDLPQSIQEAPAEGGTVAEDDDEFVPVPVDEDAPIVTEEVDGDGAAGSQD